MAMFAKLLTNYMKEKYFTDISLAETVRLFINRHNLKTTCKVNREMFYQWKTSTKPSYKNCLIVWVLTKIFELSGKENKEFIGAACCNDYDPPINENNEVDETYHLILSSSKNLFIKNVLDSFKLPLHSPIMLLSQHEPLLIKYYFYPEVKNRYSNACFFINLPDYADEMAFYVELGELFQLSGRTPNSMVFKKTFVTMLQEKQAVYFCCINRFGHLSIDVRRRFAALLRSIYTECYDYLHLVLLGGQKLEELRYSDVHSLLNDTTRLDWQEWTYEDVQQLYQFYYKATLLPENVAQHFLDITGGHLKLLNLCFSWYGMGFNIDDFADKLIKEDTVIINDFILFFKTDNYRQQLINFLKKEKVEENLTFIHSKFLRMLYWKNLLIRREDGLYWRSKIIRKIGQKITTTFEKKE